MKIFDKYNQTVNILLNIELREMIGIILSNNFFFSGTIR